MEGKFQIYEFQNAKTDNVSIHYASGKIIKQTSVVKPVIALSQMLISNIDEVYSTIETIYAQILDVTEYQVVLKCLIDKEQKVFQTRKFDKIPFDGVVDLTINNFVKIKIYTRPGERKFTYENMSANTELKEIFEPKNYFEGLENTPFFKSSSND